MSPAPKPDYAVMIGIKCCPQEQLHYTELPEGYVAWMEAVERIRDEKGETVAIVNGEADARLIVACVNEGGNR